MQKIKPIQATYQYYNHFLASSSQKQQQQPDLQTGLNNSYQLFSYTIMFKFEDLTNKIAEKSPSKAMATGKTLRKGRPFDAMRASSETSSESESELEEQERQKEQKIKINSSETKANNRKKCQKWSGSEPEQEYNDRVSLHAEDISEVADKEPTKNGRIKILTLARKS